MQGVFSYFLQETSIKVPVYLVTITWSSVDLKYLVTEGAYRMTLNFLHLWFLFCLCRYTYMSNNKIKSALYEHFISSHICA